MILTPEGYHIPTDLDRLRISLKILYRPEEINTYDIECMEDPGTTLKESAENFMFELLSRLVEPEPIIGESSNW